MSDADFKYSVVRKIVPDYFTAKKEIEGLRLTTDVRIWFLLTFSWIYNKFDSC